MIHFHDYPDRLYTQVCKDLLSFVEMKEREEIKTPIHKREKR